MPRPIHITPRSAQTPNALPAPPTTVEHYSQTLHPMQEIRDPPSLRSSALTMFTIRLSAEKPVPKPYYYSRMNLSELAVWEIIGEEKYKWVRGRKGKLYKQRLTPQERAARQKMFYDTRVGHGVCGDEWMRKELPKRAP